MSNIQRPLLRAPTNIFTRLFKMAFDALAKLRGR
jgi:hypothetical protein